MITLQINGKRVELERPTALLVYLEKLGVNSRAIAVEHNGAIIERAGYETVTLTDGDTLEIVRMVGGGCYELSDIAEPPSVRQPLFLRGRRATLRINFAGAPLGDGQRSHLCLLDCEASLETVKNVRVHFSSGKIGL